MLTKSGDEVTGLAGSPSHLSDWAEFTGEELPDGVEEESDQREWDR